MSTISYTAAKNTISFRNIKISKKLRLRDNKERLCEKLCLDRSLFRGAVKRNLYVPLSMPRAWHSLSYRRETLPQFNKERCTESFHGHFSFLLFYCRKMSLAISSKKTSFISSAFGLPFFEQSCLATSTKTKKSFLF